jgi:hypothetical protein
MSLKVAVAVPFRQRGVARLGEGEFVVAVSLDRDWFSPDQAKRLLDVAVGRGLLEREDGDLVVTFDPDEVDVPENFRPDEDVLREQSTFETILSRLIDAGADKQAAVAAINERQRNLGVTLEAAALVHARAEGLAISDLAGEVRGTLATDTGD